MTQVKVSSLTIKVLYDFYARDERYNDDAALDEAKKLLENDPYGNVQVSYETLQELVEGYRGDSQKDWDELEEAKDVLLHNKWTASGFLP